MTATRFLLRRWRGAWIAMCFVLLHTAAAVAQTAAPVWTWGIEADTVSRYVWRGIPYSDGAVLQPWTWAAGRGFTFTVWSNLVAADEINRGTFDQVFVTASWQRTAGRLRFEPTLQGYSSRSAGGAGSASTLEASFRASIAAAAYRVFSTHTVDVATFAGDYVGDVGLSRTVARPRFELTAQVSAGWASASFNDDYVGVRARALDYAAAGGTMTIRLAGPWYLRPHVDVYRLVGADVQRALGVKTLATAGLAIGRGH